MNTTKTIRLPPRRFINKRKERGSLRGKAAEPSASAATVGLKAAPSNQLLAGYLAHEFLTEGTLFGHPSPSDAPPPQASASPPGNGELTEKRRSQLNKRYVEVSYLLKGHGAHFESIVNPTQLGRFLDL